MSEADPPVWGHRPFALVLPPPVFTSLDDANKMVAHLLNALKEAVAVQTPRLLIYEQCPHCGKKWHE
jgi:hypothetical protein